MPNRLPDRESRVAAVLARATALSEELKGSIQELSEILRSESEEESSDGQ